MAFDDGANVLSFHASHDDALVMLREHAAAHARLHLDIRFTGSVDAISALNDGRCKMAGFHTLPSPAIGSLAQRTYQPLLQPGLHKIIGFARRTQGLVVPLGNPLALQSLADLRRTQARFVNRALGTGTRVLTEERLSQARQVLRSPAWQKLLGGLVGYAPDHGGQVLSLGQQLPWWQFDRPKKSKRI